MNVWFVWHDDYTEPLAICQTQLVAKRWVRTNGFAEDGELVWIERTPVSTHEDIPDED
jgi:hypothetical protein